MTTNKSACCGAEIYETLSHHRCTKCDARCYIPTLPDREQILEFVENEIKELEKIPFVFKCLIRQAEKIKQFIEGKEEGMSTDKDEDQKTVNTSKDKGANDE